MKVQVLGPGCKKCQRLYREAQTAVARSGLSVELSKVDKIEEIMKFGVMITPALVVDGQVKAAGRVPDAEQIANWLREAAANG